jgi:hypothetical protein
MRTNTTPSLRTLLKANPDGLDVGTIANYLEREPSNIRKLLATMPDTYIDRWVRQNGKPPNGYLVCRCAARELSPT